MPAQDGAHFDADTAVPPGELSQTSCTGAWAVSAASRFLAASASIRPLTCKTRCPSAILNVNDMVSGVRFIEVTDFQIETACTARSPCAACTGLQSHGASWFQRRPWQPISRFTGRDAGLRKGDSPERGRAGQACQDGSGRPLHCESPPAPQAWHPSAWAHALERIGAAEAGVFRGLLAVLHDKLANRAALARSTGCWRPPAAWTCQKPWLDWSGWSSFALGEWEAGCEAALGERNGDPLGTSIARTCCVDPARRARSVSSRPRPRSADPHPEPRSSRSSQSHHRRIIIARDRNAKGGSRRAAPIIWPHSLIGLARGKRQRAGKGKSGGSVFEFHTLAPSLRGNYAVTPNSGQLKGTRPQDHFSAVARGFRSPPEQTPAAALEHLSAEHHLIGGRLEAQRYLDPTIQNRTLHKRRMREQQIHRTFLVNACLVCFRQFPPRRAAPC